MLHTESTERIAERIEPGEPMLRSLAVWQTAFLFCIVLVPFALYFSTVQSIVSIWNSSETFAHGYIILPISLWLIWRKRQQLRLMIIQPYWPALLLIALVGSAWLIADVGDVQVLRQYSLVALIPLLVLALFGRAVFQALIFPLWFLMLAVPFGDIFIPPLINFTADFTVIALQLTGIPVLREGSTFTIPSGNWSVVTACSGVRYLIASMTLGCLFAYLSYRSWKKRWLFMLAATVVPVIANGMRAYLIVMLGHLSGMTLAVGVDHLIYGWLFFGLVMSLLFAIGNRWNDSAVEPDGSATGNQSGDPLPPLPKSTAPTVQLLRIGFITLLVLLLFPVTAREIERANYNPQVVNLTGLHNLADHDEAGCTDWQPRYLPAQSSFEGCYTSSVHDAYPVKLIVKYYRNQRHDAQLISSSNRMALDQDDAWRVTAHGNRLEALALAGKELIQQSTPSFSLHETSINGSRQHILVWSWNWINGHFNNNSVTGKIMQSWDRLTLSGDDGAAIMLVAPFDENPEEARVVLRRFATAHLSQIEAVLDATRSDAKTARKRST